MHKLNLGTFEFHTFWLKQFSKNDSKNVPKVFENWSDSIQKMSPFLFKKWLFFLIKITCFEQFSNAYIKPVCLFWSTWKRSCCTGIAKNNLKYTLWKWGGGLQITRTMPAGHGGTEGLRCALFSERKIIQRRIFPRNLGISNWGLNPCQCGT